MWDFHCQVWNKQLLALERFLGRHVSCDRSINLVGNHIEAIVTSPNNSDHHASIQYPKTIDTESAIKVYFVPSVVVFASWLYWGLVVDRMLTIIHLLPSVNLRSWRLTKIPLIQQDQFRYEGLWASVFIWYNVSRKAYWRQSHRHGRPSIPYSSLRDLC